MNKWALSNAGANSYQPCPIFKTYYYPPIRQQPKNL